MRSNLAGVCITCGPQDWQIIQRRWDGKADLPLSGTWNSAPTVPGTVEARLVVENLGRAVSPALDWQPAATTLDGTWGVVLRDVPAGGLYRLETRFVPANGDRPLPGDRLHHLGVGDLWIIAGQSNAVGYGQGEVDDPVEPGVHLFRMADEWALASHPLHDSTRTRYPANFEPVNPGQSPWLTFGREVRRATGLPIGLIPAALGGSPLCAWDPGEKEHPLFDNMLNLVQAASSWQDHGQATADGGPSLRQTGEPPRVAGVIWFQGCSDGNDQALTASYGSRFVRFMEGLRGTLAAPALPFITCQLNKVYCADNTSFMFFDQLRSAQWRVAREQKLVALVPTLDQGLGDMIHNHAAANIVIGRRAALAALGMVYGHNLRWQAPDIAEAAFVDEERLTVRLRFAHVADQLWLQGTEITQFTVTDETGGGVPVRQAQLTGKTEVQLSLFRPPQGRAWLHNSPGRVPTVNLFDRELRPVPGFAGFEIA